MHTLREYQRDAANAIWKGFKSFDRQLAVLPTGAGKTVIFSQMAAYAPLQPALILTHRDELTAQACDKISEGTGFVPSVEKASSMGLLSSKIVVGSVQTLCGIDRLLRWPSDHFKFLIVDEAHHALSKSWQTVLSYFAKAKILGVTATPHRGDRKNLGRYFENIPYEISLLDLVKQGFLSRIKVRTVPLKIDLSSLTKKAGDFSETESGALLDPLLDQIGLAIVEFASHKKVSSFSPCVRPAASFAVHCKNSGWRPSTSTGMTRSGNKNWRTSKVGKSLICVTPCSSPKASTSHPLSASYRYDRPPPNHYMLRWLDVGLGSFRARITFCFLISFGCTKSTRSSDRPT
jgi:hypothetical protein